MPARLFRHGGGVCGIVGRANPAPVLTGLYPPSGESSTEKETHRQGHLQSCKVATWIVLDSVCWQILKGVSLVRTTSQKSVTFGQDMTE